MKETPILFSAPMVNAILDGRKTMTRRVVKMASAILLADGVPHVEDQHGNWHMLLKFSPYHVGGLLWVRETFKFGQAPRDEAGQGIALYLDEHGKVTDSKCHPDLIPDRVNWCRLWKKRPSIFMPRWASRITLKVTSVRVERLLDISEDDAAREGIKRHSGPYILDFAALWDSINGKRASWDSNPWVWVVSFERVTDNTTNS